MAVARKKKAKPGLGRATPTSRRKISATLEEHVVREIEAVTDNISEFLNEAAKRHLYFERLRRLDKELEAQGVEPDEEWGTRFWAKLEAARAELKRRR